MIPAMKFLALLAVGVALTWALSVALQAYMVTGR